MLQRLLTSSDLSSEIKSLNGMPITLSLIPYTNFEELKQAFCKRYRKVQADEQAYMALRNIKQGPKEKVEEYYERVERLSNSLRRPADDGFLNSIFRAGLLLISSLSYDRSAKGYSLQPQRSISSLQRRGVRTGFGGGKQRVCASQAAEGATQSETLTKS